MWQCSWTWHKPGIEKQRMQVLAYKQNLKTSESMNADSAEWWLPGAGMGRKHQGDLCSKNEVFSKDSLDTVGLWLKKKKTQVHLKIAKGSLNVLNTKTKDTHSVKGILTRKISAFYYVYF